MQEAPRARTLSERQWCWLARLLIALGVIVACAQWIRIGVKPGQGDFPLHWEFGRRLAAGEFVYRDTLCYTYPCFWALAHSPLSVMPLPVAHVVTFTMFFVALALLLWVLRKLVFPDGEPVEAPQGASRRDVLLWTAIVAVLLASRYLVRDMVECGVNLMLVALSWLAVWLWTKRREVLGGTSLGLAMSLKCTPGMFLLYFLWKREWKMAACTVAAGAAFTLSPVLVLGLDGYARAMHFWTSHTVSELAASDLSEGVMGNEQLQNSSLAPALNRYLMTLPRDSFARVDHPLYVDFLDLSPATAGLVSRLLTLGLLAFVFWNFRARTDDRGHRSVVWECAAVSILVLLYSPITWGQHCVGVLPVCYLLAATWIVQPARLPRWQWAVVWSFVGMVLVLNRGLVGKQATWLLDSYHVNTMCLIGFLLLAVAQRNATLRSPAAARQGVSRPGPSPARLAKSAA